MSSPHAGPQVGPFFDLADEINRAVYAGREYGQWARLGHSHATWL
jgi:hypothetical protein